MVVLSLFDGMSCGQIALKELGIKVDTYYASEIDKHAIKQTQLNFPDTIQLGNVEEWKSWDIDWSSIDLILAGSPCQGFSVAGKMLGHDDPRSKLYWVFLDILHHVQSVNPNVKFLLENVRMRGEDEHLINESLGVHPVEINSSLVSAQNRARLYWSNIKVREDGLFGEVHTDIEQPEDKGINLRDILDEDVDDKYYIGNSSFGNDIVRTCDKTMESEGKLPFFDVNQDIIKIGKDLKPKGSQNKASCLSGGANSGGNHSDMDLLAIKSDKEVTPGIWRTHIEDRGFRPMAGDKAPCLPARARNDGSGQPVAKIGCLIRRLTPIECSRLQTIPEWYQWKCPDSQAYKMLGNGWTIDVIKHILSHLINK